MPTGETKDAGWQSGVQKTLDRPVEEVWDALTGDEGLSPWLGEGAELPDEDASYRSPDGRAGKMRSLRPGARVRLTSRVPGEGFESTVQIALRDRGEKTTVVSHEVRLPDVKTRERRREHWQAVASELEQLVRADR